MNTILTKKLYERYPVLFAGKDKPITESSISFGIECGDGWFWLIDNVCNSIQKYVRDNKVPAVEFTQIKEKYGLLDISYIGGDDIVCGMVWMANDMSGGICEYCGSVVNVSEHTHMGYYRTLCESCGKTFTGEKQVKQKVDVHRLLNSHPHLEYAKGIDSKHIIIDKDDVDYIKKMFYNKKYKL